MDLSVSAVISGLLFGGIGFWMLKQSRQKGNFYLMVIALALMIYPYFTHGPVADWGVGIGLCYAAHHFWNH